MDRQMADLRGPKVTLALSHGASAEVGYVKEMDPDELYEALGNLTRWNSIHGRGRTEQALGFKAWAKPQIDCIKSALRDKHLPTMRPREEQNHE